MIAVCSSLAAGSEKAVRVFQPRGGASDPRVRRPGRASSGPASPPPAIPWAESNHFLEQKTATLFVFTGYKGEGTGG